MHFILMRLWSIHGKYLDRRGLIALWREGLLGKKVLEGSTRGYKNHPQLNRFKSSQNSLHQINDYLHKICDEAEIRGYSFNRNKLAVAKTTTKLAVTSGQIKYEWKHLLKKLRTRSKESYIAYINLKGVDPHPSFVIIPGKIADWEVQA